MRPSTDCGGVIDWVDFVMINDITYGRNVDGVGTVSSDQLGEKVGTVAYMLDEHACADHKAVNGDAAFLPIGTPIYAMKGYKPSFRVIADNKVYQAGTNPNARTMADLLDIEGKVARVGLDSGNDGSAIGDFTPEASEQFVQLLLPLAYVGTDETYKKTMHESGVFLRVYLKDGTSFRMVFYPKANAIGGAFGTEPLKALIMAERQRIKAAAGL
ncbi:hypothetical protein PCCS19_03340 [Paenibacillus sp. CCS19]|nr:hypothetical protein PCCS19_03340 [Paenibacillus cellulosilyticus]